MKPETFAAFVSSVLYEKRCVSQRDVGSVRNHCTEIRDDACLRVLPAPTLCLSSKRTPSSCLGVLLLLELHPHLGVTAAADTDRFSQRWSSLTVRSSLAAQVRPLLLRAGDCGAQGGREAVYHGDGPHRGNVRRTSHRALSYPPLRPCVLASGRQVEGLHQPRRWSCVVARHDGLPLALVPSHRETPSEDFMVAGNNTESLLGVCESMWRPNMVRGCSGNGNPRHSTAFSAAPRRMRPRFVSLTLSSTIPPQEPEELFEVVSQCLLAACNRDCLSGWGGIVHVMCATFSLALSLSLSRASLATAIRCAASSSGGAARLMRALALFLFSR